MSRARTLSTALAAALVTAVLTSAALAADGDDAIEAAPPTRILAAQIGLAGRLRGGRWSSGTFDVGNFSAAAFRGELHLVIGGLAQATLKHEVRLAPGAQKRLSIPFFSGSGDAITVELRSRGRVVHAAQPAVRLVASDTVLVATVGDPPPGVVRLGAQKDSGPRVEVAALTPSLAPLHPLGYQAADVIVWFRPRAGELSPAAQTALVTHVAGGGRLIVAAAEDWREVAAATASLLPAELEGADDVAASLLTAGLLFASTPASALAPAVMARARPRADAEVIASAGGRPLVIRGAAGFGEVTLVATRPDRLAPRSGAPSTPSDAEVLWRHLLGATAASNPARASALQRTSADGKPGFADRSIPAPEATRDRALGHVASELERRLPVTPLDVGTLLVALVAYLLVIGPADYLVLKRLDRLEWTWLTYPVIVLAFVGFVATWGHFTRSSLTVSSRIAVLDVIEPAAVVRRSELVAMYSPQKAIRRLESSDAETVIGPGELARDRTTAARLVEASSDAARPYARLDTKAAAVAYFEAYTLSAWPTKAGTTASLGVEIRRTGQGENGQPGAMSVSSEEHPARHFTVTSALPFALDDALIVAPTNEMARLGPLVPGQPVEIELTSEAAALAKATATAKELWSRVRVLEAFGRFTSAVGPARYRVYGTRARAGGAATSLIDSLTVDGAGLGSLRAELVRVIARDASHGKPSLD